MSTTGEMFVSFVPAGMFLCLVPAGLANDLSDWTEVAAIRLVRVADDQVVLEATNDLDSLTRPDGVPA